MKCGIVVFPGSNCDHDCYHILKHICQVDTQWIWHKDEALNAFDFIVLPGGFSYGDYLRPGAIARFSPIMKSVIDYANRGGRVLGICNGFQILVESGLLPGVLMDNRDQRFICKDLTIRVENNQTPFTAKCGNGEVLRIPINHGQGRYFTDAESLNRLEDNGQILFRYCDAEGELSDTANPNGSLDAIAGVCNEAGNVMGMMPHPERCADPLWTNVDGQAIFNSLIQSN
ncbi:MAG: phosphoribosylformylglycinamidine synthase subunit PurQ [Nitrospinaceae bacterium]|nr:phosphoribosylformylglycinamidine synthase subunit PurQ [Nitrospinaceae bacterium]NIR56079.1 phosphoribosylformylglycinamidine synthase subunit PurQ [Nitrospinaceae bacterium]NIS86524.1 phosphoribosylformylglycinamidine synthase subunit PurQ [Nitrospinaceae bacterium]NIT83362.1 phosphoribosylformylglycinamidine synthase subunit PurQ [Nitrospinaceae bacterium]NIU45568.1 phosphoribosylformylglycinamidine synthase subunit PurQ [Nitrospinaceae bacterium]